MGNVITNLKAKFGVDSSDFKKGLKDGEKATQEFKAAAGSKLDEFASMFGVNMKGVNDAIGAAGKSLSSMGSMFKGASEGGNKLVLAFKALKTVMIASGVGALVVALGSLITYFKGTGEGADKFAVIMAKIRSVIDNIIDRFQTFGGGLADIFSGKFKDGWEKMRGAFKGIGDEIKEDWQAAGDLEEAMNKVKDREVELITTVDARRAKVAELRLLAQEEIKDMKSKADLLMQAEALTRQVYGDQVDLEKERLRIMEEQLARSASDPTREQRREVAEQEAKINQLLREQNMQLKGIVSMRVSAQKVVSAEVELEERKAAAVGFTTASIENLKLPDLTAGTAGLQAFTEHIEKTVASVSVALEDLNRIIEESVNSALSGFGEWLGNMAVGLSSSEDLVKMIGGVFGNMLKQLGEVLIATGTGLLAIKESLQSLNPYVAIAAGVALVALGAAVQSAVSSIGSSTFSGGPTSGGKSLYDARSVTGPTIYNSGIDVSGEITMRVEGNDLVAVINKENMRMAKTT
jgi:hypothetical protein